CRRIRWRATTGQSRARQAIDPPYAGHRAARLESHSGQALAQPREGYPSPVYQYRSAVGPPQRCQNLEGGHSLVAAVIEQELMVGVELPYHADSLKSRDLVDTSRPDRHHPLRAGREPVVFGLPQLAPMPLPAAEQEEHDTQGDCQDREN